MCIAQFDAVYAEGKGKVTVQSFQTEREPHRNKGRLQGTVQMSENPSFSLVCAGKHTGRGKKQNGKQRQRQDYRQQTEEQPPDAGGGCLFFSVSGVLRPGVLQQTWVMLPLCLEGLSQADIYLVVLFPGDFVERARRNPAAEGRPA